jgi:hypothetical protein
VLLGLVASVAPPGELRQLDQSWHRASFSDPPGAWLSSSVEDRIDPVIARGRDTDGDDRCKSIASRRAHARAWMTTTNGQDDDRRLGATSQQPCDCYAHGRGFGHICHEDRAR